MGIITAFIDPRAQELFSITERRVLEVAKGMRNDSSAMVIKWWFEGTQHLIIRYDSYCPDALYRYNKKLNIRLLLR